MHKHSNVCGAYSKPDYECKTTLHSCNGKSTFDTLKRRVRTEFHKTALKHPLYTIEQVKEETKKVKQSEISEYLTEKSPDLAFESDNSLAIIGSKTQHYISKYIGQSKGLHCQVNGYQTVDCHHQYAISDQDIEQGKAVNAGNLQETMDYLLEGHPQGAVTNCQACEGTGYIDPEVSQGSADGFEIADEMVIIDRFDVESKLLDFYHFYKRLKIWNQFY